MAITLCDAIWGHSKSLAKILNIPLTNEVGEMRDSFCLWGHNSDRIIIITVTQQLNPMMRLSNNNPI